MNKINFLKLNHWNGIVYFKGKFTNLIDWLIDGNNGKDYNFNSVFLSTKTSFKTFLKIFWFDGQRKFYFKLYLVFSCKTALKFTLYVRSTVHKPIVRNIVLYFLWRILDFPSFFYSYGLYLFSFFVHSEVTLDCKVLYYTNCKSMLSLSLA